MLRFDEVHDPYTDDPFRVETHLRSLALAVFLVTVPLLIWNWLSI